MNEFTHDTFFEGRLNVRQHQKGYRFSIDAVLLGHFASFAPGQRILDMGSGCGIIPIILAYRNSGIKKIWGIEIQKELADMAAANVLKNNMESQISILCQDLKNLTHKMVGGPVDAVISNPPYRKRNSGRINPSDQKAIARHEIKAELKDIVNTARKMLDISGKFLTIYPAERMAELLEQLRKSGLEPKFLQPVYSTAQSEAKLILVEAVRGGRSGMKLYPPLIIYNGDGSYTQEVAKMFKP